MLPADAAWVREHVLAPKQIPPALAECPCQGLSDACEHGEHGDCGLEQWSAWEDTEPETVIGSGFGPFPCKGATGLEHGDSVVYLADRICQTWCACPCHQPPPPPSPSPAHAE
uniref:hypothetical protein n=1 Tax=Streptomyces achromogenes TaxID=67255 RepID=UPI003F496FAB